MTLRIGSSSPQRKWEEVVFWLGRAERCRPCDCRCHCTETLLVEWDHAHTMRIFRAFGLNPYRAVRDLDVFQSQCQQFGGSGGCVHADDSEHGGSLPTPT